jgi:hypothetical protein
MLVAGWLYLALIAGRNIPIFALVAGPVAGRALSEWLEKLNTARVAGWLGRATRSFREFTLGISTMDRLGRVPALSVAAILLLAMLAKAPAAGSKLKAEYDPKRYPAQALAALQPPECAGRIFTPDEWGDYLIYRLYPKTKVFVDGRSDFYGADFNRKYLDMVYGKYDWEKTLEHYGVRTVLLPADFSLASTLKASGRWQVVHDDGVAIVFRSAAQQSQWARAGCAEREQVSAAVGGGFIGDRLIAQPNHNHRDREVTKLQLNSTRRKPS